MARTLHADLLIAQQIGYPTANGGGYQPAVRCIFTSSDGSITYDYSFNPALTTNRLVHVQQIEGRESDPGVIRLKNPDWSIPDNLNGYYVDLGWGLYTTSGIRWDTAAGAVSPRLWVMQQSNISGGLKNSAPSLYTDFVMAGVWDAVLNKQSVRIGTSPLYKLDEENPVSALQNKTIYSVLEYLIETALSDQTGLTFTLEDLGTQDDGLISSLIPFPTSSDPEDWMRTINSESPSYFDTYGEVIRRLLELTKCMLIPKAGLAFKIIYPQSGDTADETYYSSVAAGHPFYEVEHRNLNMVPNHIEILGGWDDETGKPTAKGHWFDTDHYSGWVSPAETATYDGPFMPITSSGSTDNPTWELGLNTNEKCINRAAALGWQLKDQMFGQRVIIPMDARVELYDRVSVSDRRGK